MHFDVWLISHVGDGPPIRAFDGIETDLAVMILALQEKAARP
jgi:hypothetical protein